MAIQTAFRDPVIEISDGCDVQTGGASMEGAGMGVTGNAGGLASFPAGGGGGVAPSGEEVFLQGTRGTGFDGPLGVRAFRG